MKRNETNADKEDSKGILKKLNIKQRKPSPAKNKSQNKSQTDPIGGAKEFSLVATCMQNLEAELENELGMLGAKNIIKQKRAVKFMADMEMMYKANIWLRTAIKILKPLYQFKARNEERFYQEAKKIKWEHIFSANKSFAINAVVNSDYFKHSQFVALKLKDAIVDHFRAIGENRPNVDRDDPDVRFHLHINDDRVNISIDSSGDPLFKRGYRKEKHGAPINECLAAGLILKSGWKGEQHFLDPMCGSGTLAIEAALIASNIPPNYNRIRFAFESWKDYDAELFSKVLGEAKNHYKPLKVKIIAREIQSNAVRATRVNINAANMRKSIMLEQADFFKEKAPYESGLVMMNPPYGERLKVGGELTEFYAKIGSTLKHEYEGWNAWIISSEMEALKSVGLKPSKKIPMMNGKLACQFRKYELFQGTLKEQRTSG